MLNNEVVRMDGSLSCIRTLRKIAIYPFNFGHVLYISVCPINRGDVLIPMYTYDPLLLSNASKENKTRMRN